MSEASPIDSATREMLDEFSDGTSFYDEVLSVFMLHVHGSRERLERALEVGDRGRVEFEAHRFRSGAASIGALDLSERCAELERFAQAANNALDEVWRRVDDELARVLSWVEEHRPQLVAA